MSPRARLVIGGVALAASSLLAWFDPWARQEGGAVMVSNRSAARRLFPGLGERSPDQATFEFQSPEGERIRLLPSPDGGHVVMSGDKLLGPADPEAIGGIWASLRMATTLRAVSPGVDVGAGDGGVVRVNVDDQNLVLRLGRPAPDGSGLYGVLEHEGDEAWVVEEELAWLVTQPAQGWLSHHLLELGLESVRGLTWGERRVVTRGEDGQWRSAGDEPALLSAQAVELRLDRLVNARLDPMLDRETLEGFNPTPWLLVNVEDGSPRALALGGPCPDQADRRVVDRGPGLVGCIDAALVDAWELDDPEAPLLESKLVPVRYQDVLAVRLEAPVRRTLRRRTGGWLLDEQDQTVEVIDDEVYRWFSALSAARLDLSVPPRPAAEYEALEDRAGLVFETGPSTATTLRCGVDRAGRHWCRRDEGPLRALAVTPEDMVFDAETFADRRVLRFAASDVRALEVEGRRGPRQSIRRDLGVWRLDAPSHPDAAAAVDEVRVEGLLAALGSLRADAWVDPGMGPVARRLRIDTAPAQGSAKSIELEVDEDCVARLSGQRDFRLTPRACEWVREDLLFDDPLRNWLRSSRELTVRAAAGGQTQVLVRRGEAWSTREGESFLPELEAALSSWGELRSAALVRGRPPGPIEWELDFTREQFAPVALSVGRGWAGLRGADWYYRLEAPQAGESAPPAEPGQISDTRDERDGGVDDPDPDSAAATAAATGAASPP